MLNLAIPKGRMGDTIIERLADAGYDTSPLTASSRKLIFELDDLRVILVKPSDVDVYVEHGAADLGIVGRDVLLEAEPDVYELMDLGTGACHFAVAAPEGYEDDGHGTLRVASKYPHVTRRHFARRDRPVTVIKLNGSVELAPLVGLSDVIVDIVETGSTLRANGLHVVERIADSTARVIANRASYQFKREAIDRFLAAMAADDPGTADHDTDAKAAEEQTPADHASAAKATEDGAAKHPADTETANPATDA